MGIAFARDNYGYNIGFEMTKCYQKCFDHHEVQINQLIDGLKVANIQIKILSDFTSKLAHGKEKDKKFDISKDESARKCAYLIHLRSPSVLEGKIHNLPVEHSNLEQKLNEIIDQMKEEGIPDSEIDLGAILERFQCDSNIRFDVLDEATIDVVLQGVDAQLKMLNADLNKILMDISSKYEDRAQMIESARLTIKEDSEEKKSIIQKTGRSTG